MLTLLKTWFPVDVTFKQSLQPQAQSESHCQVLQVKSVPSTDSS